MSGPEEGSSAQPTAYEPENELIQNRYAKAMAMRERGENPYANNFDVTHTSAAIFSEFGTASQEELETAAVQVSVAGRVRFRRVMGKASFLKLQEWSQRAGLKPDNITADGKGGPAADDFLQLFVRFNDVGEQAYAQLKELDLGDFVGARGVLMRTRTGELSVRVHELVLLTKTLRPLPDKWHGLSDVETRFRQRYLDLAMNPAARRIMRVRSQAIRFMRDFFFDRDYVEVETPTLVTTPGGAEARPFETHHNALHLDMFLRIAPELFLKRLLVGGLGRVFEIGRVFRNEGLSRKHNPEFTILEFYQAYATYEDLMELTETLLSQLVEHVHGSHQLTYDGQQISFQAPFARVTVAGAVAEAVGLEEAQMLERDVLDGLAEKYEIDGVEKMSSGKLLLELFELLVESTLVQPTFVIQYPMEVSPLSRKNDDDPRFVDRFELFVAGSEIANAFSELNDPVDQHGRFLDQLRARAAGDEEAHPMDADYVRALEYGMPPAAGQGIGVDRLIMLLTDAHSIREVIAFPLLRPE